MLDATILWICRAAQEGETRKSNQMIDLAGETGEYQETDRRSRVQQVIR